ncbi:MAG: tetratricopeptide repeat protein [Candidatus Eisenbacteria bacterium]
MKRSAIASSVLLASTLLLGACQTRQGATTARAIDPQVRSQALIDSGNAAYKAKDFAGAAKRYASAVSVAPGDPAAHYGLGMALAKLGRDDEARAAYARAREMARALGDSTQGERRR